MRFAGVAFWFLLFCVFIFIVITKPVSGEVASARPWLRKNRVAKNKVRKNKRYVITLHTIISKTDSRRRGFTEISSPCGSHRAVPIVFAVAGQEYHCTLHKSSPLRLPYPHYGVVFVAPLPVTHYDE